MNGPADADELQRGRRQIKVDCAYLRACLAETEKAIAEHDTPSSDIENNGGSFCTSQAPNRQRIEHRTLTGHQVFDINISSYLREDFEREFGAPIKMDFQNLDICKRMKTKCIQWLEAAEWVENVAKVEEYEAAVAAGPWC